MTRIAVIGAGCSGLAAIKCCLDEGLDPVCFEKTEDIGGLWRYEKDPDVVRATVHKNTYLNTGKTGMAYSDFPTAKDFVNNPHNTKVLQYYREYAEKFDLIRHIKFNTEVIECAQAKDFDSTGKWNVKTKTGDIEIEETFDAVMVAVGHHSKPYLPVEEFEGLEDFKGRVKHSLQYRDFHGYEDKNVLVVGLGNSGCDIAVELSWHAKQVYASTKRGTWVLSRAGPGGIPFEEQYITRYQTFLFSILPASFMQKSMERDLNSKFNHSIYGLKPKHGPYSQHPTMNDDLPNKILNGSVIIKPNVKKFTADSVIFENGTEHKIDAVVFATGFDFCYPFLDNSIIKRKGNFCALYKYMWPVGFKKNTLAMIGHLQPLGCVNTASEMQCRWATRVFKGLHELPNKEEMLKDIEAKKQITLQRYYNAYRHFMDVDHVPYMDEIANEIGSKPNLWKLLLTDPKLAYACFFRYCAGFQYRLMGPGKWKDARKYILAQRESLFCPLKTREVEEEEASFAFVLIPILILSIAVIAYLFIN